MAINPQNYGSRGGNLAIILLCPNIVADDHLVYFDYNKKSGNWVIRDFITRKRLDNFDRRVPLTVAQIEADATWCEHPAWLNVEHYPVEWQAYLKHRTTSVRQLHGPLQTVKQPNPASGNWRVF